MKLAARLSGALLALLASFAVLADQYALPYGWTGGNGATGQCLTSNGSVLLPSFQACGTGGLAPIPPSTLLCNNTGGMAAPSACTDVGVIPVTPTGGTNTQTLAAIGARQTDPAAFGAPLDTQQLKIVGVTATATQSTVVFAQGSWSAADVGKNIVIAGIGTAGAPLATTITSYSSAGGATIGLGATVGTTVSGATEWVAWGHDDAPAINAAITASADNLILPKRIYGQFSGITLPQSRRISLNCAGSTIVALASMATQVLQSGNGAFDFFGTANSDVSNCKFDGMGVATYNIHHQGFGWVFRNSYLANATTSNLLIDTNGNNFFEDLWIRNDTTVVNATYNIDVEHGDNHFTDVIVDNATSEDIHDNGGANYWTNIHAYGNTVGPIFHFLGAGAVCSNCYADGVNTAGEVGFQVDANSVVLNGWVAANFSGSTTTQVGVKVGNSLSDVGIFNGRVASISSANVVVPGTSDFHLFATGNIGASYESYVGLAVVDVQTFTGSGTWTKPTGSPLVTNIKCIGAGGGGGSGAETTLGTAQSGGAGGGGGGFKDQTVPTSSLAATVTVTIGTGGTGGTALVGNGNGTAGTAGTATTFGSLVTALAGGGGAGGVSAANSGGGGGAGFLSSGSNGSGSSAGGGGAGGGNGGVVGGTGGTVTTSLGSGGAGGISGAAGSNGGDSFAGGPSGAAGGGLSTTTAFAGGQGGLNQYLTTRPAAGTVSGGAGGNGANPALYGTGSSGGGGAGNAAGAGGAGGTGGIGAGGGGGGASAGGNSGAGGNGGTGYCAVVTYF